MKAIIIREFGPPEVMRYETLPDPEPRYGEVRIRIHAATVNRTLDVSVRRGTEAHRGAILPLILGVDCAGVIDKVGDGVTGFRYGERVATAGPMPLDICPEDGKGYSGPVGMMGILRPGGFAELICVPACKVSRLPPALNFHDAAVVMRHCPTAWNLLCNVAQLKSEESVLIMGASGNLGTVGIQIAKNIIGANVICAAGSRERANIGLEYGANHAIDYSNQDLLSEVMRLTSGRGVNVLFDNVANPHILPQAFHALGTGGQLVTAGAHAGPNVTIDFFHLYDRCITIFGTPRSRQSDLPLCFSAAAEGKIKVRVAHVLPLSKAVKAHQMMESDPGVGKIVLDPTAG